MEENGNMQAQLEKNNHEILFNTFFEFSGKFPGIIKVTDKKGVTKEVRFENQ
jgi:hypothetical protein